MLKHTIMFAVVAGLVLALAPAVSQALVITLDDLLDQTGGYTTAVDIDDISGEESIYIKGTMTYDVVGPSDYNLFAMFVDNGSTAEGFPDNYRWGKGNGTDDFIVMNPSSGMLDDTLIADESHEVVVKISQTGGTAGDYSYWLDPVLGDTEANNTADVTGTGGASGTLSLVRYRGGGATQVDYTGFAIYTGDDTPFATVTTVPGDTNGNGIVDAYDLDRFENQFGGAPSGDSADFDDNGIVDLDDFAIIRGNWNFGVVPTAPEAAPEPATMSLLALGGLMALRRRRQRVSHG